MVEINKIIIEQNDSTTSYNGNIRVEMESKDLSSKELKLLALEVVEKIKRKKNEA